MHWSNSKKNKRGTSQITQKSIRIRLYIQHIPKICTVVLWY